MKQFSICRAQRLQQRLGCITLVAGALLIFSACKTRTFNSTTNSSRQNTKTSAGERVCGRITHQDGTLVLSPASQISSSGKEYAPDAKPIKTSNELEMRRVLGKLNSDICLAFDSKGVIVPGSLEVTQGPANALPELTRLCGKLSSGKETNVALMKLGELEFSVTGNSRAMDMKIGEAVETGKTTCINGKILVMSDRQFFVAYAIVSR